MSLDLCLKQLHVHINVFHRIQYIRLLLFYAVIFQSCKFQSPVQLGLLIFKLHSKLYKQIHNESNQWNLGLRRISRTTAWRSQCTAYSWNSMAPTPTPTYRDAPIV